MRKKALFYCYSFKSNGPSQILAVTHSPLPLSFWHYTSVHSEWLLFHSVQICGLSVPLHVSKHIHSHTCFKQTLLSGYPVGLCKFNRLATVIQVKKKLVSFQDEDIIDHFCGTKTYTLYQCYFLSLLCSSVYVFVPIWTSTHSFFCFVTYNHP